MGLLAAVLGMGLSAGEKSAALVAAFSAGFHVLVKGGLFLADRSSRAYEALRLVGPGAGHCPRAWSGWAPVDRRRACKIGGEAIDGRGHRRHACYAFSSWEHTSDAALFAPDVERLPSAGHRGYVGFIVVLARDRPCSDHSALDAIFGCYRLNLCVTRLLPKRFGRHSGRCCWARSPAWRSGVGVTCLPHIPAGDLLAADKGVVRLASATGAAMEKIDGYLREWPVASAMLLGLAILLSVSTFLGH